MRALAVVWVVLFHSFVLSGLLIGGQVLAPLARGEPLRYGDFYLRRAFRILPAFVVVLALYLAWPRFRETPIIAPWWRFASFTLNFGIDKVFRPQRWQWLQARANALLLAGLAVCALAMWLFRELTGLLGNAIGWPVLSLGLALLVIAGASTRSWIGRRALPGAGWLAAVSYSLYLSHKTVLHLTQSWFGAALDGHGLLAFAIYAAMTLLAAALLHYAVERPCLGLRDRRRVQRCTAACA